MKNRLNPFLGTLAVIAMTQAAHAASVTWNVAGNGTWDTSTGNWTGGSPTANLYVNGDTASFTNTAGGAINLSGTIAPAATNVSAASGTYTFTGTGITSGTLTKTGAGNLILQNSNSYSGATTVRGLLTINSGGAITGGGALTIGGGSPPGTLQYDSSATSTFGAIVVGSGNDGAGNSILNQSAGTINATALTLNNGYTGQGAGDVNLSGGLLAVSGTVTASNQVAGDNIWSTITISNDASLTIGNGLRLTGAPSATRNAAGRVTQDGGTVTVSNGLNMARTTASNTAARRGEYNLNGGILTVNAITQDAGSDTFGTFNFNGGTLKASGSSTTFMQGLTTANVKDGGANIDTNGKNITIGQSLLNFAGATTDSLTKSGTGTLTLTGSNTYSGATAVNAGTLVIDGSTDASSAVSVAAGTLTGTPVAKLGGTGTIGGTLNLAGESAAGFKNGGVLAPGDAGVVDIETLNAGTTTWNGGSIWEFDLSSTNNTSDQLAITGDLTKGTGSGFAFNFMGSQPVWNTTFTLATWTGTTSFLVSDFAAAASLATLGSGSYSTSYFTLNSNSLTFTAVPEPTSALAGLLITAGLLRRRRA